MDLQLQRYRDNDNGLELIIDTATGKVFASQGMLARLCGCDSTQIRKYRGGHPFVQSLSVEDSRGVKQFSKLYPEQLIKECLAKYNPDLLLKCADIGLRVFLHEIAGYDVISRDVRKDTPKLPQTFAQALRLAAEQAETIEAQQKTIEASKPKVALAEAIAFSESSVSFNEFAKAINTGRTRLFRKMRECGVILKGCNLPYQKWIEAGYFEVSQEIINDRIIPFALVTGKGQLWLHQRLQKRSSLEKQAIGAIAKGVLDLC